jgi:hypothetical protein
LGIFNELESIESHSGLYNDFRNCKYFGKPKEYPIVMLIFNLLFLVWADNGDYLSKQYAGTGALKSDFTRYVST